MAPCTIMLLLPFPPSVTRLKNRCWKVSLYLQHKDATGLAAGYHSSPSFFHILTPKKEVARFCSRTMVLGLQVKSLLQGTRATWEAGRAQSLCELSIWGKKPRHRRDGRFFPEIWKEGRGSKRDFCLTGEDNLPAEGSLPTVQGQPALLVQHLPIVPSPKQLQLTEPSTSFPPTTVPAASSPQCHMQANHPQVPLLLSDLCWAAKNTPTHGPFHLSCVDILAAASPRAATPGKTCEGRRLTSSEGGGGFLRVTESNHILICKKSHRRQKELAKT